MTPIFDPRVFDARAFYAPHDEAEVTPTPWPLMVTVEKLEPTATVEAIG